MNPDFVPGGDFTSEDYFVWSRCDGVASIKQLIQTLGMGTTKSLEILERLRSNGAIVIDGETQEPDQAAEGTAASAEQPSEGGIDLTPEQKTRISAMIEILDNQNLFEFLGVTPDAKKREYKRAYFKVSKEFHPDRFYGKSLGEYGPQLSRIFETATKAYAMFSDERQRMRYIAKVKGENAGTKQTKEEHASMLFSRACETEIRGELDDAIKLFTAAVRSDGKAAYYKRAAMCALRADQAEVAEEMALKAVEKRDYDPSYVRVLADAYRKAGKLAEAEKALDGALGLNCPNDKLMGEIQKDLEAVRSALEASRGQNE